MVISHIITLTDGKAVVIGPSKINRVLLLLLLGQEEHVFFIGDMPLRDLTLISIPAFFKFSQTIFNDSRNHKSQDSNIKSDESNFTIE